VGVYLGGAGKVSGIGVGNASGDRVAVPVVGVEVGVDRGADEGGAIAVEGAGEAIQGLALFVTELDGDRVVHGSALAKVASNRSGAIAILALAGGAADGDGQSRESERPGSHRVGAEGGAIAAKSWAAVRSGAMLRRSGCGVGAVIELQDEDGGAGGVYDSIFRDALGGMLGAVAGVVVGACYPPSPTEYPRILHDFMRTAKKLRRT